MKIILLAPTLHDPETATTPIAALSAHWLTQQWHALLTQSGHHVLLQDHWDGEACELLISLDFSMAHDSIRNYSLCYPDQALVLIITQPQHIRESAPEVRLQESLSLCTHIVVLDAWAKKNLALQWSKKLFLIDPVVLGQKQPHTVMSPGKVFWVNEKPPSQARLGSIEKCFRPQKDLSHWEGSLQIWVETLRNKPSARLPSSQKTLHHGLSVNAIDPQHAQPLMLALAEAEIVIIPHNDRTFNVILALAIAQNKGLITCSSPKHQALLGNAYPGFFSVGVEQEIVPLMKKAFEEPTFIKSLQNQCKKQALRLAKEHPGNTLLAFIRTIALGG